MNLKAGQPGAANEGNQTQQTTEGAAGQSQQGEPNKSQGDQAGSKEGLDESKWDADTKAYIEKLRRESATHRTKAKDLTSRLTTTEEQFSKVKQALGLDSEAQITPEQKIQSLEQNFGHVQLRNAILEQALANGIGADGVDYFTFLVEKEAGKLKENEELSEETLARIAQEVKGKSTKASATTSVTNGGQGSAKTPPAPGGQSEVNLDQFVRMSIAEKSTLFVKSPELYKSLTAEARRTNRLV